MEDPPRLQVYQEDLVVLPDVVRGNSFHLRLMKEKSLAGP